MRLSELHTGETAYILKVNGNGAFRKRLQEMGFVRGQEVKAILNAPLKDPIKYEIMDYEVSLRRSEAVMIEITMLREEVEQKKKQWQSDAEIHTDEGFTSRTGESSESIVQENRQHKVPKNIKVALVGNPNSGKTSIFNLASGAHEHVGNYSGVTVDAKEGTLHHQGYTFTLVDLPGTYSLAGYTPEELYVRRYIVEEQPDIVINVVAASAIERSLYLTTELIDMEVPMVIALNMYDELEQSGRKFDYQSLATMIGTSIIPTVGKKGLGIPQLLNEVIRFFASTQQQNASHPHIPYGRVLERAIEIMEREFQHIDITPFRLPLRYICIKLLEGDSEIERIIRQLPNHQNIFARRDKERAYIEKLLHEDAESAFTNARYGFIAGGLEETLSERRYFSETTRKIDAIVTNKYLGFPLFFLFMWIMFEATFKLGEYPMQGIEWLVEIIGNFVRRNMADGPLKDLIVDGIIGGVGGVIVFLPNIVILYLFIAFMEDSGYMSRASFIMDKVMHKMGLHGKSFIPLIMGFGCNVPAIMATRTIESRSSRMITMLIVPFMSCSARLPVYLVFVGIFFSKYASLVLLGLYVTGILLAVLSARLFRKTLFTEEDTPFVMELPPYRMPTLKSIIIHMWDRSNQYLKKMGGPILLASIVIWFLGYFPRNMQREAAFDLQIETVKRSFTQNRIDEQAKNTMIADIEHIRMTQHQENSLIGQIGKFIEPVMRPLGFDWKISVSLLSGMAAKEIVVSTLGVLYAGNDDNQTSLQERLKSETYPDGSPVFTPLVVIGFLLFVLIYFPCIATIAAIKEESGSWKWAAFSIFYSTGLAWMVALLVHQIGLLVAS